MVYLFLADGFEEVEAITPVDVLRRAGAEVATVRVGGADKSVRGAHGITVTADMTELMFTGREKPEMIVFPGGMPGTKNLDKAAVTDRAIECAQKNDAYICAICAAPSLLGRRGLLRGKNAVCYPGFEDKLEGANVLSVPVTRDGKLITARGAGAALAFSLELAAALFGRERAEAVVDSMIRAAF